jgi:glutathione synthase/RimK-type ligase-like ATP-grasp enzyme
MQADIALLTDRRYEAHVAPEGDWYLGNILQDDRLLQTALRELGLSSVRVDWSRTDVAWSEFPCAVFRTTWDYFDRQDEFAAWIERVQSQTRLCNDARTIAWNMNKHYLADLAQAGIAIVPSRFVEVGTKLCLAELLDETHWPQAVIKPCVSGAARHTYRVQHSSAAAVEAIVQPLLETEAFLLQPFQQSILEQGEDSLMVFNGRFSHAVRKVAKPGDFRVQDDHGGTVHPLQPTVEQIELAERAMAACGPVPAYGRVDMVQVGRDRFAIMELELIEPELWLRFHPPAATAFAHAIAQRL